MVLLQAAGVTKAFGVDVVLKDISLTLTDDHKMGIVGVNGSGKTTFLRIVAGLDDADGGMLQIRPELRIGYHAQLDDMHSTNTLMQEMERVFDHVFAMEERLRAIETEMGRVHDSDPAAYARLSGEYVRLSDTFEEAGGYSYRSQILGVLAGLGLTREMHDRQIDLLSGGERTRVKLAKLLLQKPDLLVLDEPTNHLDLEAISWLEGYLVSFKGALMVVSHDRYFLDAICNTIVEFQFGTSEQYQGNYTRYLQLRAEQYERQMKVYAQQQKEISRQKAIIERYRRYNQEWSIHKAKTREHVLERMELVDKPMEEHGIEFTFMARRRTGQDVLIAEDLSKSYGEKRLFEDFSVHLRAGDRVALIGPNGIGKTTLLRILMGQEKADGGTFFFGSNVDIGYYDQQQTSLTGSRTLIDEIWEAFPRMQQTQVRSALAAFLFTGDDVFKTIDTLSGGERGRVMFTKLMLRGDNVLVLDEPTNHLDMDSREVLESALDDFGGTILFVSHDRFFINRIANRVIEMTATGVTEYLGNYDDYLEAKRKEREPEAYEDGKTKTAILKEKRKERMAKDQERALRAQGREMEREIERAEAHMAQLEQVLADPETYKDGEVAQRTAREYEAQKKRVSDLYDAWAEHDSALND